LAIIVFHTQEVPGDDLSVYRLVEKMRQQRPAMVQAKDQYVFVYLAVAELSKRALGMKPNVPRKPNGRVGDIFQL
jgi:protein tyrosine phosphatase